jgi:hypothetical protein
MFSLSRNISNTCTRHVHVHVHFMTWQLIVRWAFLIWNWKISLWASREVGFISYFTDINQNSIYQTTFGIDPTMPNLIEIRSVVLEIKRMDRHDLSFVRPLWVLCVRLSFCLTMSFSPRGFLWNLLPDTSTNYYGYISFCPTFHTFDYQLQWTTRHHTVSLCSGVQHTHTRARMVVIRLRWVEKWLNMKLYNL